MSIQFGSGLIIDEDKVALRTDTSNIFNIGISTSPSGLLNISRDNDPLLSFDNDSILIHKNFKHINDETVLFESSHSNNGTLYVGGFLGIGTTTRYDSNDSLHALTNIRTDKDIFCKTIEASESVNVKFIRSIPSNVGVIDSNGSYSSGNEIQLIQKGSKENIVLIADTITLLGTTINLNAGSTTIANLEIKTQTFSGINLNDSIASKLIVTTNPPSVERASAITSSSSSSLLIQHDVVSDTDTFTPLLIESQIGFSTDKSYKDILKVSKEGHLLIGVNMITSNTDSIIRGRISSAYDSSYSGLLHLSSYDYNSNGEETDLFVIDKSGNTYIAGNVGIGTTISSSHSLDVMGSAMISGNVGIGIGTDTRLDVTGSMNISEDATFNSNVSTNTLTVTNSSMLSGTLAVNDNSTFAKDVSIGSNLIILGDVGIGTSDTSYGFTVCKNAFIGEGANAIKGGGPYFKQGVILESGVITVDNTVSNIITITPEQYGNIDALSCAGKIYIQLIIKDTKQIATMSLTFIYYQESDGFKKFLTTIEPIIHKTDNNWPRSTPITLGSSGVNITVSIPKFQTKLFWTVIGGSIYSI